MIQRLGSKIYIRTPWGEVQLGKKTMSLVVWHRGRLYRVIQLRKPFTA